MRFDRVRNFRDVGGVPVAGGITRPGRLFRSGHLGAATSRDRQQLTALGIRTVVDLRSSRDASGKAPNRLPEGITTVDVPISGDHDGWRALARRDPVGIWRHVVRPGAADALLRETYVVNALSAGPSFGRAMTALATDDALPAVVHCRQGKDRTGWLVALILDAVGASWDDVVAEYLRSNAGQPPIVAGPLLRQAIRPMVRADASWLDAARDAVEAEHGSLTDYRRSIGVDAHTEGILRSMLVEPTLT